MADYCVRCGSPHDGRCLRDQPRTIPEKLDAAETGAEFGAVLQGLFSALEKAKDDE